MFCSECGKTIDDEAVICPECGAVTKKGILKLQETAKQGTEDKENLNFTTIKPKDDSKIMRLVAMIIGLVGSALLLSSLLGEFAFQLSGQADHHRCLTGRVRHCCITSEILNPSDRYGYADRRVDWVFNVGYPKQSFYF